MTIVKHDLERDNVELHEQIRELKNQNKLLVSILEDERQQKRRALRDREVSPEVTMWHILVSLTWICSCVRYQQYATWRRVHQSRRVCHRAQRLNFFSNSRKIRESNLWLASKRSDCYPYIYPWLSVYACMHIYLFHVGPMYACMHICKCIYTRMYLHVYMYVVNIEIGTCRNDI